MTTKQTAKINILNPQGRMPRGIDDFGKAIIHQCCFVDKTLLVKELLEGGDEVTLITRPRRFGKTINQSMLRYFFELPAEGMDTQRLFADTLIAREPELMKQQGKYPVISLTLKSAKLSTWEKAYNRMCTLIRNEIDRHPESQHYKMEGFGKNEQEAWARILSGDQATQSDWEEALQLLCKLLTLHYNQDRPNPLTWIRPILLIDEYDAPIHAAYTESVQQKENLDDRSAYYQQMMQFMRPLLGNTLKGNPYLYKAVLTGILRVAKEDLFSGLNNIGVYGLLDDLYCSFFGFTEPEVKELLEQRDLSERAEVVRSWYNGYQIGNEKPCTIYNPWSVISYLINPTKVPKPYWVNTSDNALVDTLLRDAGVKEELLRLLAKEGTAIMQVTEEDTPLRLLKGKSEELWSLLLAAGYATCKRVIYSPEGGALRAALRIPNIEVKSLYKRLVASWFRDEPRKRQTIGMVDALKEGDIKEFTALLEEFVLESMSYFHFGGKDPERVY